MLPERDIGYRVDIETALRKAQTYAAGQTWEDLLSNELLQHTLIRMLTIIGEAATKLSKEAKQTVTGVSWEDVTGMRHRLVHEYFRVNLAVVWETVRHDLPDLLAAIQPFIPAQHEPSNG
ncbi:MAG TPA: HepT-like ribonuclease domain-containing protein [bacterium]|jgi:uncharacterized protein with HEPN domain